MYAIIADGGRQYKVQEGQELVVDYRQVPPGSEVRFDHVLALADDTGLQLGKPTLPGASVVAKVLGAHVGEKLYIQKFRRRKNYRRRTGHRQMYTRVLIAKIHSAAGDRPPVAE